MSKILKLPSTLLIVISFISVTYFVGCEVNKEDVVAGRQKVAKEQQETEEVRQAHQRRVREAEQQLESARQSALKVPYEGGKEDLVLEKEMELEEAKKDLKQEVSEEEQETEQAKREAEKTEARLAATKDRDAYVELAIQKLAVVDKRLETLEASRNGLEGTALQKVQTAIEMQQEKRVDVSSAIDQVNNSDVLQWLEKKRLLEESLIRLDEVEPRK